MSFKSKIRTIQWVDNVSRMVDQTKIPYEYVNVDIKTGQEMYDAIQTMIVRGAPAIGIAGAHGVVLYAQELEKENLSREDFTIQRGDRIAQMAIMEVLKPQIEVLDELSETQRADGGFGSTGVK